MDEKTKNYLDRAKNIHGDKYKYLVDKIISNKQRINIVCKTHGVFSQLVSNAPFEEFNSRGFICIKVLPELNGRPWNDVALGYLHSLRPSRIRVIKDGWTQCDSRLWRVTVYLEKDGETIKRIDQEIQVGLPEGCNNGAHLKEMLKTL